MKLIIIICLIVLGYFNMILAQTEKKLNNYKGITIQTEFDLSELKSFINLNSEFLLQGREIFVDTIRFAHNSKYFFNNSSIFIVLSNGNYVIGYSGSGGFRENKSAVYLYNKDGKFLKEVAQYGQGPGEVTGVLKMDKDKKHFYVSDGDQRKIIIFNNNGEFIREIKQSREWSGKTFRVSPVSGRYFYYHIFPSTDTPLFTMGSFDQGIIRQFGKIGNVNKIAMFAGGISGMVFNEFGYLFVIKPAEYGFAIYGETGEYIGYVTQEKPSFFQPPSEKDVRKIEKNLRNSIELFYNNSRSQKIFYLSNNILVILYCKNYLENGGKITYEYLMKHLNNNEITIKFISYLEFWKTDGEFLGRCKITGKYPGITHAEKGYFYYWYQQENIQEDGLYPNPYLIRYDLWKELGWRK